MRAAQEGIAFAFRYGAEIMRGTGVEVETVRVPHANLFLSDDFAQTFATAVGARVDLVETDGAAGAARGAGIGLEVMSPHDASAQLTIVRRVEPGDPSDLKDAYRRWRSALDRRLALDCGA